MSTHFPDGLDQSSVWATPLSYYPHVGWSWDNTDFGGGLYNHLARPNSSVPDCVDSTDLSPPIPGGPSPPRRFWAHGMSTARSHHPGGVNVLFLDGGVRFVGNSIDLQIWRGIGTIAGGEVTGEGF